MKRATKFGEFVTPTETLRKMSALHVRSTMNAEWRERDWNWSPPSHSSCWQWCFYCSGFHLFFILSLTALLRDRVCSATHSNTYSEPLAMRLLHWRVCGRPLVVMGLLPHKLCRSSFYHQYRHSWRQGVAYVTVLLRHFFKKIKVFISTYWIITDKMELRSISSITPASSNTGGQYQML
jgi:hypothetical protein